MNLPELNRPGRFAIVYRHVVQMLDLRRGLDHPEEIDADVRSGVMVDGVNLWVLMFAILIASVGLNVNSTAVIIGAMLISPLMGPIVGVGYGLAILDFSLVRLALRNLFIFTMISLVISVGYFTLSPLDEPGSELLARTSPTLWDVLIAFFGGAAGAIALTRRDFSNVLPGVAIATALMPPLCTAGFAMAHGRWDWMGGALYLYTINGVFIGVATLLIIKLMRLRSPSRQVDAASVRQARWLTMLTVIAVVAPSIYLAQRLVKAEAFAAEARRTVAAVAKTAQFVIIDSEIDGAARRMSLTVGGEYPPADLDKQIAMRLQNAGFTEATVVVRSANSRAPDVRGIKKEIQSSLMRQLAQESDVLRSQIKLLQSNADERRVKADSDQAEMAMLRQLSKEIQAQYPQIGDAVVGRAVADASAPTSAQGLRVILVQIKQKRRLSQADLARLRTWLSVRLPDSQVRLAYE